MKTTLRLSLIMLLCIVVCLFVVPAAYAETVVESGTCGAQGDNLTWILYDNGNLVVEGNGAMEDFKYDSTSQRFTFPWTNYLIKCVTLKNGVTSIGNYAFYFCTNLTDISIPKSTTNIGVCVFNSCWGLTSIIVDSANPVFCDLDGVLYSKDMTILWRCPSKISGEYVIPDGVMHIGNDAFDSCESLENVTIPDSITSIGSSAFYKCHNLITVTIPKNVTSIEGGTFLYCYSLEKVTIPENVKYIGNLAFNHCSSLTSITIPNSVTSIGISAFSYCTGLTSIIIPNSVTSIERSAFFYCDGLTDVYYSGTKEQWNQISFGNNNDNLTSATIHYRVSPDLILPADLITIEQEAFAGGAFTYAKLSDNTVSIAQRAFADCPNLIYIYIPEATTSIDPNAFGDLSTLTVFGKTGSTAEIFAQTHGFTFVAVP